MWKSFVVFFNFLSQHFSVLEHTFSTIYMERWTWKVKVDFFLHTFSLVSITSSITLVLRLGTTQVWGLVFGLFGGSSWSSKFGMFRPDILKLPLFGTIFAHSMYNKKCHGLTMNWSEKWRISNGFCVYMEEMLWFLYNFTPEEDNKNSHHTVLQNL